MNYVGFTWLYPNKKIQLDIQNIENTFPIFQQLSSIHHALQNIQFLCFQKPFLDIDLKEDISFHFIQVVTYFVDSHVPNISQVSNSL